MPVVTFKGRVFPQVLHLTINPPITMGWKNHPLVEFDCEVEVKIDQGALDVKCTLNKFDFDKHMGQLYKEAYELSGVMICLYTFASGNGTTIIFDTFTLPNGTTSEIRTANESLADRCTVIDANGKNIHRVVELAMAEPLIHYALRDLNECFLPNRTTVNCARVVETIRTMIHPTPGDGDRRPAWLAMQEALNFKQSYTQIISKNSLSHRHGAFEPVDGPTNEQIIQRTWEVMNRFLEFRIRGNQALSAPDFPELS